MNKARIAAYRLALAAAFSLICLLAATSPARAADTNLGRPTGELFEVALLMDSAVLDLNMLIGEEQSAIYRERMDATLQKLETALKASTASLGAAGVSGQNIDGISRQVAGFVRLARENRKTLLASGAPENAVVDEMMQHRKDARKILDAVYDDLEKRAGLSGSALSESRELAMLLSTMASTYVENASAAYVANRSQDSQEKTIDQLAKNFSGRLTELLARARGDEATKLGRSLQSKWKFIERSMLNYQEKTVPFLVDRYTQAIVADLLKLAQVLDKQR